MQNKPDLTMDSLRNSLCLFNWNLLVGGSPIFIPNIRGLHGAAIIVMKMSRGRLMQVLEKLCKVLNEQDRKDLRRMSILCILYRLIELILIRVFFLFVLFRSNLLKGCSFFDFILQNYKTTKQLLLSFLSAFVTFTVLFVQAINQGITNESVD